MPALLTGPLRNQVSKHIRALERARLVRRRREGREGREGREHILSFNPGPPDELAAWIELRAVDKAKRSR